MASTNNYNDNSRARPGPRLEVVFDDKSQTVRLVWRRVEHDDDANNSEERITDESAAAAAAAAAMKSKPPSEMKLSQKSKPTIVSPSGKRPSKRKASWQTTRHRKKPKKFSSLKEAEKWANAFDESMWIHGKTENQTRTGTMVPKEIVIRNT